MISTTFQATSAQTPFAPVSSDLRALHGYGLLSQFDCGEPTTARTLTVSGVSFSSDIIFQISFRDYFMLVFSRFGDGLLSHVLGRSTIGATVLNCRVRDGVGCFTRAMITKPRENQHREHYTRGFDTSLFQSSTLLFVYGF